MDKSLRSLERLQNQDPLRLKLLQRRLGQGIYVQEAPRPIQVFNDTELLINLPENKCRHRNVDKEGTGFGDGTGYGFWLGNGYGDGYGDGSGEAKGCGIGSECGSGDGDGHGDGHGYESGAGVGYGYGSGLGSQSGEPEGSYTRRLKEKYDR